MARFQAQYEIDSFAIDMNFYVRHFWDELFYDNLYYDLAGRIYQDVYLVNGWNGDLDLMLGLGGTGFRYDEWSGYSGTVTGMVEAFYDGPEIWSIQDTAISASRIYRASLTLGIADDRAVLATMLAGHDVIQLSRDDDRFEGWAGNDRMHGHDGWDALFGGTGNDMLDGGRGQDRLMGEAGSDRLIGGTGDDQLEGGAGADALEGGSGRDRMFGGVDATRDVFVFRSTADSMPGARRDVVIQFRPGQDDLDLSAMDANTGRGGNQAFAYGGTTAAAHAVWHVKQAGGVLVKGDLNGNAVADFEIWVADVARLGAGDFIF